MNYKPRTNEHRRDRCPAFVGEDMIQPTVSWCISAQVGGGDFCRWAKCKHLSIETRGMVTKKAKRKEPEYYTIGTTL